VCRDLIGKRYSFGANGDEVDCIALVIQALDRMGIDNPGVRPEWYGMTTRQVIRELEHFTERIEQPTYDGDIVLLASDPLAFGVTWQSGILYVNRELMRVDWKPSQCVLTRRCFRMRRN
jgi:hypothetical protein